MKVKVNGDVVNLEKALNITDLLTEVKAEQPEYVTVQRNGEFVQREDFDKIIIEEGDEIEFLYFMGGGNIGKVD